MYRGSWVFVIFLLLLSACNNTGSGGTSNTSSASTSSNSTSGGGTTPLSPSTTSAGDTPNGSGFIINLQSVVPSNSDPSNLLDLVGQNGEIGLSCPTAAACSCVFTWTDNSNVARQAEVPLSYVETNLARCSRSSVTNFGTFFNVQLTIGTSNQNSNSLRVYAQSPNSAMDPSLSNNYSLVQRFICKDSVLKNSNYDTNFYTGLFDPRFWDMGYGFNFFTTSFGSDYGAVATASSSGSAITPTGYECALNPGDTTAVDMNIYSLNPVNLNNIADFSTGDTTIYPVNDNLIRGVGPSNSKCITGNEPTCEKFTLNRHDFYVANFQSGVFNTPVCVLHKVGNLATGQLNCVIDQTKGNVIIGSPALAGGPDIIGFAATPDANQNCPAANAATLPPNKKWAKMWQFRASLPARTIAVNTPLASLQTPGQLFCTNRGLEDVQSSDQRIQAQQMSFLSTIGGASFGNIDDCGTGAGLHGTLYSVDNTDSILAKPDAGWFYECQTKDNTGWKKITGPSSGADDVSPIASWFNPATTTPPDFDNRHNPYHPGGSWCDPRLRGRYTTVNSLGTDISSQDIWLVGNGGSGRSAISACIEADTVLENTQKWTVHMKTSDTATATDIPNMTFPVGTLRPDITSAFEMLGGANYTDQNTSQTNGLAQIYQLVPKQIETSSRFDSIYVISPPSVTLQNMQNPNDNTGKQYTPYRMLPVLSDAATSATFQLTYNLQLTTDTTSASNQAPTYPLCVLQDTQ